MELLTHKGEDNTEASPVRGSRNDYPEREYTQASGSPSHAQKLHCLFAQEDIVLSVWKHTADVKYARNVKKNCYCRNSQLNKQSVNHVEGRSKRNDIKKTLNLNEHIKGNMPEHMIDLNTCMNTGKKMLKGSMSLTERLIRGTSQNMMSAERNGLKNTRNKIGHDPYLINMSMMVKLSDRVFVASVEKNVKHTAIIPIITNLLKLFGYAENVIPAYIGERLATSLENQMEFNRLTALPAAGGAMGEGATTPTRNSTYARVSAQLKVIRRKGSVTNFLQDSSANYIDAAAAEMESHLTAHVYDMIIYMLFGNLVADSYSFSGLDLFTVTNRVNEVQGGAVPTTLSFLDTMIDANLDKQGAAHRKAFVMSPQMISKISQLLTNVRLVQGLSGSGMSTVEIPGGWRLAAYRDIPIIASGACRPKITLGTVTTASAGSGAVITDDEYFFRVSAITWDGESLASAEVSESTTNADTITISWTAITGAMYYKVYEGLTTGVLTLIRVIAASTYDANGTITGNNNSLIFTADPAVDTSVPTGLQSDLPLVATGGVSPEYIFFWDLDEFQGMGKLAYTNSAGSRFNGLVTMYPLAQTDDNLPFLVKTYAALIDSFEATCSIHRGLRVA